MRQNPVSEGATALPFGETGCGIAGIGASRARMQILPRILRIILSPICDGTMYPLANMNGD